MLNSLSYQHLLYCWTVARERSITRATDVLHLMQPTIGAQLKVLEQSIGATLFMKQGRSLALTETGRLVFQYADDIFRTGRELPEALAGGDGTTPTRLVVDVYDVAMLQRFGQDGMELFAARNRPFTEKPT